MPAWWRHQQLFFCHKGNFGSFKLCIWSVCCSEMLDLSVETPANSAAHSCQHAPQNNIMSWSFLWTDVAHWQRKVSATGHQLEDGVPSSCVSQSLKTCQRIGCSTPTLSCIFFTLTLIDLSSASRMLRQYFLHNLNSGKSRYHVAVAPRTEKWAEGRTDGGQIYLNFLDLVSQDSDLQRRMGLTVCFFFLLYHSLTSNPPPQKKIKRTEKKQFKHFFQELVLSGSSSKTALKAGVISPEKDGVTATVLVFYLS